MTGKISIEGIDDNGGLTRACLGRGVDKDFGGILLVDCDAGGEGSAGVFAAKDGEGGGVRLRLVNPFDREVVHEECLATFELSNGGGALGPRGGSQLGLTRCAGGGGDVVLRFAKDGRQVSKPNEEFLQPVPLPTPCFSRQLSSLFVFATTQFLHSTSIDACLTSGWPFIQAGAFLSADGSTRTLVFLNEADEGADIVVEGILYELLPHSVKTVVLK